MKNIKKIGLAFLLSSSLLNAEMFDNHQVGAKVSTLGLGLEYTTSINDMFSLRTGVNKYTYNESLTESDIKYDADLDLQSIALILDYHPFSNGFRLSAGAMYNGNELNMTAKPTAGSTYEINNTTYSTTDIGKLDASVDFNKFAPYLGLGYDSAKTKKAGFSFNTEIGVMFQGSANVNLTATCGSALNAAQCDAIKADVAEEQKQLNDEINDFDMYPVVSIGLAYKF